MQSRVYGGLPWAAWTPIDSEPVTPANAVLLRAARSVIGMSKFGMEQLHNAGFENAMYVPHGVDTDVFNLGDREEARRKLGQEWEIDLDGKYLVVANSLNVGVPPRKGFYEMLAAFKIFSDKQPEALLYLHCEAKGRHGVNMQEVMKLVDLDPKKVIFPTEMPYLAGFYTPKYLNDVYNAGDVFLHASHGEGFGIPIIEAQASGCPVVVPRFSAMPELVMYGEIVEKGVKYMRVPGGYGWMPDVGALAEALENAHGEQGERQEWEAASAHRAIKEKYGLAAVAMHWEQVLVQMEGDIAREKRDGVLKMPAARIASSAFHTNETGEKHPTLRAAMENVAVGEEDTAEVLHDGNTDGD